MRTYEQELLIRKIDREEKESLRNELRDKVLFYCCAGLIIVAAVKIPVISLLAYLAALIVWLIFTEALWIPRTFSDDMNPGWHIFRPKMILENAFSKDKGWRTLILFFEWFLLDLVWRVL